MEETLSKLPQSLRYLLSEVMPEKFGTKPFISRYPNPDYQHLAEMGLLAVVPSRRVRREGYLSTTYQMPEAVYDALRALGDAGRNAVGGSIQQAQGLL